MGDFFCAYQQIYGAPDEGVGHVEADDVWRELAARQAGAGVGVGVHHKMNQLEDEELRAGAVWAEAAGLRAAC